ncbi:MAG: Proteasome subunit beta type-7 [Thelocarpon superellum]|nr:MAG: Proteasome subunit beta type-7 [Thelocarpon superellum]
MASLPDLNRLPNLDIPPSPPGSPPASTTAKFTNFLELKKKGIHFNDKLAQSSALKNPSLLAKLMGFAGVDDKAQYASSLPTSVWDPDAFPAWAYKDALAKSQKDLQKQLEEEKAQRQALEFVPAAAPDDSGRGPANPRDDVYGTYNASYLQQSHPNQHTQSPIVTGTSVIAVKFKDGVVIAADNLASYGSLARFTDVKRLLPFAETSIVGIGGDVSDMQYISRLLNSLDIQEAYSSSTLDGSSDAHLNAQNLHTYLSKVLYKRRSSFNPLWNQLLVAGLDGEGKPFLSSADLLGTTFSAPTLATGFGAHLAQPILRRVVSDEKDVATTDRETALAAVRECMKVLFYRDARSMDRYSIAVVTKDGVDLKQDEQLEGQSWAFAETIRGYGTQVN